MSERRENSGRVEGTVALVTGAARGVGRAQAVRLAEEGADIIAIDLCGPVPTHDGPHATAQDLDETARQVTRLGRRIVAEVADVRDLPGLEAAVQRGVDTLGRLDTVCATAGIGGSAPVLEMGEEVWQSMLDVNLTGVWHTCTAAVPHLLRTGRGSIVLTSSIAGLRGLRNVGHYVAAKHGVVGLMRTLAKELADSGIRVNTLHPTNVDTPMIQHDRVRRAFRPDLDDPTREEFAEAARTMNLLPIPWVDPVDVANATLFLASDEARYITAAALPIDAGAIHK
ncbi:mycofactocin-coupled SDR family oxidoreductase [Rhodococcus sp. NPDC058505]|uniref:mycofactocin-coupled SDR family oxidoreductase n=1 Tax=unclassified Rhodococcus (in: high G+C Gram-positive bacteria) TaxID=192944 RepID=UPI0036674E4B